MLLDILLQFAYLLVVEIANCLKVNLSLGSRILIFPQDKGWYNYQSSYYDLSHFQYPTCQQLDMN